MPCLIFLVFEIFMLTIIAFTIKHQTSVSYLFIFFTKYLDKPIRPNIWKLDLDFHDYPEYSY